MLLIIFTSFLVLMALINSILPDYNWFLSRQSSAKDILQHLILPTDQDYKDTANKLTLQSYAFENEALYYGASSSKVTRYKMSLHDSNRIKEINSKCPTDGFVKIRSARIAPILGIPDFKKRLDKYAQIGNAINSVKELDITDKEMVKAEVSKFEEARIEHLLLIRVPILGISFDVNYLGMYSGVVFLGLYFILFFSLFREKVNLKITFHLSNRKEKDQHYYTYEYASMSQVLSLSKKLFTAESKSSRMYEFFTNGGLALPLIAHTVVMAYDIFSIPEGYRNNLELTVITVTLDVVLNVALWFSFLRVKKMWSSIGNLFDDHAFALNLEYIFESIGDDSQTELLQFRERVLEKEDRPRIMSLWSEKISGLKKVNEKEVRRLLESFICLVLK